MIDINNKKSKIFQTNFDIIILAGQSNAVGYGKGEFDYAENNCIYEIYKKEKYNTAKKHKLPLKQYVFKKAGMRKKKFSGFYLQFGKKYAEQFLKDDRKLLFIKAAVGGTGFSDNCWGLNDYLYRNMIDTTKTLLQNNQNNKVVSVLWHQGETDIYNKVSKEYYKNKFQALISDMRKELNIDNVPFIAGDMVEGWYKQQDSAKNVRDSIKEVIAENDYCAFVSSRGLTGNNATDDIIHFSGKSNMEFGDRYFTAFLQINPNIDKIKNNRTI